METNTKLAEIQNLPIEEMKDRLGDLDITELAQLKTLEQEDSKPRAGALEAIDKAAAALDAPPPEAEVVAASAPEGKPAAWQAPDYTGPITIDQSDWRRRNIKPVTDVRTK